MSKLAVIWYFDQASTIWPNWRDGYRAAFEEIDKKHEVHWFLDKKMPENDESWNFIHVWDDSNSPALALAKEYGCRVGLSLTTDPRNFENLRLADVVFVESDPIYEAVRAQGIRTIKAFGTDTDFFCPNAEVVKDLPFFYPATFSPWKRQRDIAYLGKDLLCIGTVQPDGMEDLNACKENDVNVLEGYFPVEKIRDYYWRTQQILIPAVHGSERTVLEAMSMNIPVEVLHPEINKRAASYELEYLESGFKTTREFVLDKYSHYVMARQLLKGIEQC